MSRIRPVLRETVIAAAVLGGIVLLAGAVQAGGLDVGVTSGKTYGEWAAGWWQWMFSIPKAENPQDAQGEVDCGRGQSGSVWYLAGGDVGVPAERSCVVPRDKKLFFPVVNLLLYNAAGETLTVEDKRTQLDDFFSAGPAREGGPQPCDLFATIDGQSVARFTPGVRVQSPPFAMDTGDGPFGFPAGLVDKEAVTEGYWVMLPPLAPGRHTLRFGGRFCETGSFADHPDFGAVDVTYFLDIAGGAGKSHGHGHGHGHGNGGDGDENVETIASLYDAFAVGDLDTINAILDEDVIWIESEGIPYGGTFIGRDAVFAGVFAKIGEEWDDFTATVDDMFAAEGHRVIVKQRDGGTFKATGKSMEAPAISIWTLDHGRAVMFEQVIDTQEVNSATIP
jgi:uncharacterized protein